MIGEQSKPLSQTIFSILSSISTDISYISSKKCSASTDISILAISLSNNYIGYKHTIVANGGYHNNHIPVPVGDLSYMAGDLPTSLFSVLNMWYQVHFQASVIVYPRFWLTIILNTIKI